jgi:hypothetical protein
MKQEVIRNRRYDWKKERKTSNIDAKQEKRTKQNEDSVLVEGKPK